MHGGFDMRTLQLGHSRSFGSSPRWRLSCVGPKKYQSGEKDVTGGITRAGDEMARTALYEAANVLLSRITRFSRLKRWGMDIAKRRGSKRAKVALARKIGVILHRMWVDGTTYRWTEVKPIAAQA
jgi:transposase